MAAVSVVRSELFFSSYIMAPLAMPLLDRACLFQSLLLFIMHHLRDLFAHLLIGGAEQHHRLGIPALASNGTANSTGLISSQGGANYTGEARSAIRGLQHWYDVDDGLWNTTGWWNSANCLTMLADFAAVDTNAIDQYDEIFSNTLVKAQEYNLQMTKVTINNVVQTLYWGRGSMKTLDHVLVDTPSVVNPQGFLNDYYDDEGWWALGWIKAYDVTQKEEYLEAAIDIFNDMANGTSPCGGIWWDKANTYVNAIANELALSVAAHLANRVTDNSTYYREWASNQWTWFQNSGMINAQNTINDGLTLDTCTNNNATVWSYNQGVILGGLVELSKATGNETYLTTAENIALAAMKALSDSNNILHDSCEPNCGADGDQFKGIFMRNLQYLHQAYPRERILTYITDNANSIWANDRNRTTGYDLLGVNWAGPFVDPAIASTQSSALDALVAAAAIMG